MWCSVCQSDVATEVGADNRRVSCSSCGHLLGSATGAASSPSASTTRVSSTGSETRAEEARQLLDRWARGHFFDPYGPPKKSSVDAEAAVSTTVAEVGSQQETVEEVLHPEQSPTSIPNPSDISSSQETLDEMPEAISPPYSATSSVNRAETAVASAGPDTDRHEVAVENSRQQASTPSAGADGSDPKRSDPADSVTAKASSEELDRLTREIMDRVSKITEARDRDRTRSVEPDLQRATRELPEADTASESHVRSAESSQGTAAVPSERNDEDPVDHDWTQRSETQAIHKSQDVSVSSRTSIRTDVPHRVESEPEPIQQAPSTNSVDSASSSGWYNNIGQMLAYLGIIFLTAGTCGVVVSYFGGPANYAPYGWLGATIGQMLLFLGIVTLISAGMEQTSQELRQAVDQRMDEVTQRLDQIGNRIMRIEEANLDGPPKPHLLTSTERERRRVAQTEAREFGHDE